MHLRECSLPTDINKHLSLYRCAVRIQCNIIQNTTINGKCTIIVGITKLQKKKLKPRTTNSSTHPLISLVNHCCFRDWYAFIDRLSFPVDMISLVICAVHR